MSDKFTPEVGSIVEAETIPGEWVRCEILRLPSKNNGWACMETDEPHRLLYSYSVRAITTRVVEI